MNLVLQAKKISKTYTHPKPVSVLHEISLDIEKGTSTAIMGPSGEGKTTLLHILGTLEKPDHGSLWIHGQMIRSSKLPQLRNTKVGFIFQMYNLLEDLTVLENVMLPGKIARNHLNLQKKGLELLNLVGLNDRAHFYARQLSGGEKQRVAIARAFCNDPDLILADEPSGNLDTENSNMVHKYLLDSVRMHQKTLILVTHDKELAKLCDRAYLLKNQMLQLL